MIVELGGSIDVLVVFV